MGKAAEAAWCARQARENAARVTIQPDPLVESLAVSVSVAMLAPAPPLGKFDRLLERVLGRPWQAAQIAPWEDEVSGYLDQIAALTPFQTARDQLLDALHFQQAVMRALSTLRRSHGAKLRTAMRAFAENTACLNGWRMSGYDRLRKHVNFQQVLRNAEMLSLTMAGSLAQTASPAVALPSAKGGLTRTATSHGGLTWAHGWAHAPDRERGVVFVGLIHEDRLISAGPANLPVPQANGASNSDTDIPLDCGFVLPVPMKLASTRPDRLELRIFRL